jgi:hypothetical protein
MDLCIHSSVRLRGVAKLVKHRHKSTFPYPLHIVVSACANFCSVVKNRSPCCQPKHQSFHFRRFGQFDEDKEMCLPTGLNSH